MQISFQNQNWSGAVANLISFICGFSIVYSHFHISFSLVENKLKKYWINVINLFRTNLNVIEIRIVFFFIHIYIESWRLFISTKLIFNNIFWNTELERHWWLVKFIQFLFRFSITFFIVFDLNYFGLVKFYSWISFN